MENQSEQRIDIIGLARWEVLQALHAASKPQGMGLLHELGRSLTAEEAMQAVRAVQEYRQRRMYFDYVAGRVIKCDLIGDSFDPRLFDRDNGEGAAAAAIRNLRNSLVQQKLTVLSKDLPCAWYAIPSSQVSEYRYDAGLESLDIKFKGGQAAYRYLQVPAETVDQFRLSESKGSFVAKGIKPNFEVVKLEPSEVLA